MKTTDMTVANTIAAQIGGRAMMMLGAKNLMGDEDSLTFRIQGSRTVSHIRVALRNDLYNMTFTRVRGHNVKEIARVDGVYVDSLCDVIQAHTGLYTSL